MNSVESSPINWIRNNKNKLVKLIQDLVKIPSVSGKEEDVQKFIFNKLTELHLEPKYVYPDIERLREDVDFFETTSFTKYGYKDRPNVMGILKGTGGGRSICLNGHIDVVSPEPVEHWSQDPWGGEKEDDYIYGRGAGDMKAGVASIIIALQALKETNTKLKGDVFLETTIDEEDGGIGGCLYMRLTQPKADAAIIPEPAGNAIGVASAGVMYFRVTVTGIPAHAATAHYGVNAIVKMVPIIETLKSLNKKRQKKIRYQYAEVDPSMKGKATTINIGVINAGDWPSTVPALCILECRVGFPPGETREMVITQIEEAIKNISHKDPWLKEHPPKIEWFGWKASPHEQNPEHPFVRLLEKNIKKIAGIEPNYYGGTAGLDARFFVHHDTPAVTFGPFAENIHSVDERVSISSTLKTTEIILSTIMDWCEVEKNE
ncbi:MAG: ArgE/DapE family deacylase [Candidatus Lokiarchaeota archaeon]|nr:ArgE/DapE family deacylase [Candidatus Lokiarchaeota archaeon]